MGGMAGLPRLGGSLPSLCLSQLANVGAVVLELPRVGARSFLWVLLQLF